MFCFFVVVLLEWRVLPGLKYIRKYSLPLSGIFLLQLINETVKWKITVELDSLLLSFTVFSWRFFNKISRWGGWSFRSGPLLFNYAIASVARFSIDQSTSDLGIYLFELLLLHFLFVCFHLTALFYLIVHFWYLSYYCLSLCVVYLSCFNNFYQ